jgi:ABC-type Fe2+-enterobactin transport system substrate-binding protein
MANMTLSSAPRRHLAVSTAVTGISIAYDFPSALTLHSPTREKELRRRMQRKLRRWRPAAKAADGRAVTATFEDAEQAEAAIEDIERMLDRFVGERLSPKMVEEILAITPVERSRWTKDGR